MLSLMGSYPIMGNPAWSPVVSPLGVPTLMNGPGNGPLAQKRSNKYYENIILNLIFYKTYMCMLLNFTRYFI